MRVSQIFEVSTLPPPCAASNTANSSFPVNFGMKRYVAPKSTSLP
jgi:hypothetical protein